MDPKIEAVRVFPPLSAAAADALRALPVDVGELAPEVLAELEARELLARPKGPAGAGHLTLSGARYVVALYLAEQLARVCAHCGAAYADHAATRPHDNPAAGCRAFTYGESPAR
jgi:hypothetical protein